MVILDLFSDLFSFQQAYLERNDAWGAYRLLAGCSGLSRDDFSCAQSWLRATVVAHKLGCAHAWLRWLRTSLVAHKPGCAQSWHEGEGRLPTQRPPSTIYSATLSTRGRVPKSARTRLG